MKTIKRIMRTIGKVCNKITCIIGYGVLVYTIFWMNLGFKVVDKIEAGISKFKKTKAV